MKRTKIIWHIYFIGLIVFSFACQKIKEPLMVKDISKKNILINKIKIDSFYLKGDLFTSCVGELKCHKNMLYFADRMFCAVYEYDKNGKFIEKRLSRGKGPREIWGLYYALNLNKGYFVLDNSYNTFYFSNKWEKINNSRIDFNRVKNLKELRKNPNPSDPGIYEIGYFTKEIRQIDSTHVLVPVNTSHPDLNAYFSNCETFYNECYILGMLNVTTGEIDSMFGRSPPVYLEKENIPNFRFVHYDVAKNKIYISYEADSSIYIYDKEHGYQYKYGQKGINMNTNYTTTQDFKTAEKNYFSDRKKFGYYHYVEFIEETGLLFRGYKKGKHSNHSGLQIYQNNTLIADLSVPKDFKVIGYIKPYYYAQGTLDEINEKIQVYKFKLPKIDEL